MPRVSPRVEDRRIDPREVRWKTNAPYNGPDTGGVKIFLPSEDFTLPSRPRSLADYLAFCERTIEFVTARNERIDRLGL